MERVVEERQDNAQVPGSFLYCSVACGGRSGLSVALDQLAPRGYEGV